MIVNKKVKYMPSSEENLTSTMEDLDCNVKIMDSENWRILKKIAVSIQDARENGCNATFYYMRRLSEEYRISHREIHSLQERFDFYLHGIRPEDFPRDQLDEAILNGIKNQYGDVVTDNKLIVINSEVEELYGMLSRGQYGTAEVIVSPDFVKLVETGEVNKTLFKQFIIPIDFYVTCPSYLQTFNGVTIIYEDSADDWPQRTVSYRRGLSSYQRMSEYIQRMMQIK